MLRHDYTKRASVEDVMEHRWLRDDHRENIQIFNKTEKIVMVKEFFLGEETNEVLNTDLVTIDTSEKNANFRWGLDNLHTHCENAEEENITDKSMNLAPFNSTESSASDLNSQGTENVNLIDPKFKLEENKIWFNEQTSKVDKNYERDHNRQIDNGVYKDQTAIDLSSAGFHKMHSIKRKFKLTAHNLNS